MFRYSYVCFFTGCGLWSLDEMVDESKKGSTLYGSILLGIFPPLLVSLGERKPLLARWIASANGIVYIRYNGHSNVVGALRPFYRAQHAAF